MPKKSGKIKHFFTDEDVALVAGISLGAVRTARSRGDLNTSDFESVFGFLFSKKLVCLAKPVRRGRKRSKLCPRFY